MILDLFHVSILYATQDKKGLLLSARVRRRWRLRSNLPLSGSGRGIILELDGSSLHDKSLGKTGDNTSRAHDSLVANGLSKWPISDDSYHSHSQRRLCSVFVEEGAVSAQR